MITNDHDSIDETGPPVVDDVRLARFELHRSTLLVVHGELDVDNVHLLADALADAQGASQGRRVLVDLGGVTFFDAATVNALVAAAARADRLDSTLLVIAVTPFGRRVLELLDVAELLGVEPGHLRAPVAGGAVRAGRGDTGDRDEGA